MKKTKEIKVIAIPDKTRIIINVGLLSNLEEYGYPFSNIDEGDKILIYEKGKDIIDPDTKENFGSYDPVKIGLTITEIYAKFSVAQIEKDNQPTLDYLISPMSKKNAPVYWELPVKEDDVLNIAVTDPVIKIGDLVRIVFEEE